MRIENKVKQKLRDGLPTFGSWLMIGDLASAEIMAGAGFDWITVDMEHAPITYQTLPALLAGIRSQGAEAFVRIEDNDPVVIKRVLDCGAGGIIVPLVNNGTEAEAAVKAAKYPPDGVRGVSLGRASGYGNNFQDYFDSINDEVLVLAQVEHYLAVEKIDEIVAVDGLDGIFLGPYDLSGSMGIVAQFDHPRMVEARKRVIEATRKAGKAIGIHEVRPEAAPVETLLKEGFNIIACSIDTVFLGTSTRRVAEQLKAFTGSKAER
jgi:2-keto-3-deoxy-L-rhamnonate aldolase RhmA